MLHSLMLLTALHVGPPQTACVRAWISPNVASFTGASSYDVAQAVISQLHAAGWTATPVTGSLDSWDCDASIIFSVGGTAMSVDGSNGPSAYAFTILVTAYERMDSKWKSGYWWWAEHHNQYGTWTAVPATVDGGRSQFMRGVNQYVSVVLGNVEQD